MNYYYVRQTMTSSVVTHGAIMRHSLAVLSSLVGCLLAMTVIYDSFIYDSVAVCLVNTVYTLDVFDLYCIS